MRMSCVNDILVLLKVIIYFVPFLGAFWGNILNFIRLVRQIQVNQETSHVP